MARRPQADEPATLRDETGSNFFKKTPHFHVSGSGIQPSSLEDVGKHGIKALFIIQRNLPGPEKVQKESAKIWPDGQRYEIYCLLP